MGQSLIDSTTLPQYYSHCLVQFLQQAKQHLVFNRLRDASKRKLKKRGRLSHNYSFFVQPKKQQKRVKTQKEQNEKTRIYMA